MLDIAVRVKLLLIVSAQLLHVCDSYFEFSTCYNPTNHTINSNFAMNLNRLFSTLTSNAPATGFYTDAVGQGVDRVYGLILCRGDLSAGDCGNCATTAPMELMKLCPRRRRRTIWYDECFLRYKDSNFIGNVTMDPGFCMWKLVNNSDPVLFDHQAGQLMRSLSASVLSNRTGLMFASGEISFGDYNTIYGVAQCTRDISRDDCSQCLAGRISRIPERCEGKVGCIVYNGNCGVRYEIYPFVYNAAASQQPSSLSPAISPPVPTMAPQEAKPSPTPTRSKWAAFMMLSFKLLFVVDSGYMSPEYAMNDIFSVKSDVFSFGVLVLEILSGRRNTSFYQSELAPDLLTYAWKLWQDGRALDLVDQAIDEPWWKNQILRCIVIGLLCVQEAPKDRPTMSTVVLMLVNSSMILPTPSPPAYFTSSPIPKSSETTRSGERPILYSRDEENQN
ncbi:Cysteine-rich repeat secretory protein 38 [Nymphaea thermarum]|nr:Cysteine-rich repeat secretory protein 38 [Nymphaea thermarum]